MNIVRKTCCSLPLVFFLALTALAGVETGDAREDNLYQRGTKAMDERRWDRAIEAFDEVI